MVLTSERWSGGAVAVIESGPRGALAPVPGEQFARGAVAVAGTRPGRLDGGRLLEVLLHEVEQAQVGDLRDLHERGHALLHGVVPQPPLEVLEDRLLRVLAHADDEREPELGAVRLV